MQHTLTSHRNLKRGAHLQSWQQQRQQQPHRYLFSRQFLEYRPLKEWVKITTTTAPCLCSLTKFRLLPTPFASTYHHSNIRSISLYPISDLKDTSVECTVLRNLYCRHEKTENNLQEAFRGFSLKRQRSLFCILILVISHTNHCTPQSALFDSVVPVIRASLLIFSLLFKTDISRRLFE
jgi:hypothetical protein